MTLCATISVECGAESGTGFSSDCAGNGINLLKTLQRLIENVLFVVVERGIETARSRRSGTRTRISLRIQFERYCQKAHKANDEGGQPTASHCCTSVQRTHVYSCCVAGLRERRRSIDHSDQAAG